MRSYQVIRALKNAVPEWQIHVRTTAPEWLFQDASGSVAYHKTKIDIGIIQKDSLAMKWTETRRWCRTVQKKVGPLSIKEGACSCSVRHDRSVSVNSIAR